MGQKRKVKGKVVKADAQGREEADLQAHADEETEEVDLQAHMFMGNGTLGALSRKLENTYCGSEGLACVRTNEGEYSFWDTRNSFWDMSNNEEDENTTWVDRLTGNYVQGIFGSKGILKKVWTWEYDEVPAAEPGKSILKSESDFGGKSTKSAGTTSVGEIGGNNVAKQKTSVGRVEKCTYCKPSGKFHTQTRGPDGQHLTQSHMNSKGVKTFKDGKGNKFTQDQVTKWYCDG